MTPHAAVPPTSECPACGSDAVRAVHTAQERMYGMGNSFEYRECAPCGSLAIAQVPEDLERYYPPGYYSFAMPGHDGGDGMAGQLARRWLTRATLANATVAAAITAGGRRVGREVPVWVGLLAGLSLGFEARVLDVGCGDGHRLRTLRRHGFRDLTGADPNLPGPSADDGIRLLPTPFDELTGPYDVIMFHHSFEHMAGPVSVLGSVHRLLAPEGALILRLPLAGSWAWRTFGPLWVQLDPPRHLFLPTVGGLHILAAGAGFSVARVAYDSDGFQFWGSEQYRRDLPLYAEGSDSPPAPLFDVADLQGFERRAGELNARGDGDQAAFLLRKTGSD